jgi:hypothetical protein
MEHVGLVLGLEMSRLARSSQDWHHLFELCGLFGAMLVSSNSMQIASVAVAALACRDSIALAPTLYFMAKARMVLDRDFDLGISPDGSSLILMNYPKENEVTTLRTGSDPVRRQYEMSPQQVAYSPDGRLEAIPLLGGQVVLWDVSAGKALWEWNAHDSFVGRLEFSRDSRRLATGGADGLVILWDIASRQAKVRENKDFISGRTHLKRATAI